MSTLQGKIAVVTGGNSGIGYATAKELAAQGATVIITGRNSTAVEAAAKELGAEGLNVKGITADQGNLKDSDKLVAELGKTYGKIDILFINAGVGAFSYIAESTEEHFDLVMNVNLKGAYFTLSKFLPILADGAAVTFNSSVSGTAAMAGSSVYSASKAALNSLVKVAAVELAPRSIRVNTVSPGPIETPILTKTGLDESGINSLKAGVTGAVPLKRMGRSEEVAKLVVFLSSPDASFITGSDYEVGGGVHLNKMSF